MKLAEQYATSANLAARIALHQRCSTNPYGLQRWVFDRLQLESGQRVLEVGCGTRSLWRENEDRIPEGLELILTDFSVAMRPDVVCALPELPFADDAFDVVIANHMLYHVDDREGGLRDIRRVLRRGGLFFASTNGRDHLREIKELVPGSAEVSASFTLENGEEQVRRVFPNVRRDDYPDSLRVTDPELLIAYIASIAPGTGEGACPTRGAIEERIARDGAMTITKSTGAFFARCE